MGKLIKSYEGKKVADYLRQDKPGRVVLVFAHGVGDTILFIESFNKLRSLFPDIQIDLALMKGLGQEVLVHDALLISNANIPVENYDYTFVINFPMAEHLKGLWTKSSWCDQQELGIDPVDKYPVFPNNIQSPFVALNMQATALPGACNPSDEIAEKIWNEVKSAGLIPIETLFIHVYFNPVNVSFSCVDRGVRDIVPGIDKLIKILSASMASITVATGNLPLSIAMMPEQTLYLKKDFLIESYTKKSIATIDVEHYKDGMVESWLRKLQTMR